MKDFYKIIAAIILFCFFSGTGFAAAKITSARSDIMTLVVALTKFFAENYRYPTESEWPEAILQYIQGNRYQKDPWGNEYCYNNPAIHNKDLEFEIYSKGQDGKSESRGNDPDDIGSWDKEIVFDSRKDIDITELYFIILFLSALCPVIFFILTYILKIMKLQLLFYISTALFAVLFLFGAFLPIV